MSQAVSDPPIMDGANLEYSVCLDGWRKLEDEVVPFGESKPRRRHHRESVPRLDQTISSTDNYFHITTECRPEIILSKTDSGEN